MRGPTQVDSDSEDEAPLVQIPRVSPNLLAALEQDLCENARESQQACADLSTSTLSPTGPSFQAGPTQRDEEDSPEVFFFSWSSENRTI